MPDTPATHSLSRSEALCAFDAELERLVVAGALDMAAMQSLRVAAITYGHACASEVLRTMQTYTRSLLGDT